MRAILIARGRIRCSRLTLLCAALLGPPPAAGTTLQLGSSANLNLLDARAAAAYSWNSGDALVAHFAASGSIGGITGGKNVVVIPEVRAFGQTIVPEVRRDTRSGLRLRTDIDGYAGIVLSAGMTLGGDGISSSLHLGPSLTLPSQVRAGRFFGLQGSTGLDASSSFDLNLPSFNAGLDVVLGGSASGKLEYGLFPFTGYQVGNFNFNLPDINLPVFDLNLDFNLPRLPEFNFLNLPDLIPESDKDNTLYTQKLPPFDPEKPTSTVLSAGEIDLVNPVTSATTTTKVSGDGAIVNTTSGDLVRVGLDLDGLAAYAATGVSFTGLELPIKAGDTTIAKLRYDTIDVKYGVELGYEIENRVDAYLEMNIAFVDPATGDPVDVMMRSGAGNVSIDNTLSGRWDQLPELALLNGNDVRMDIDFTGLRRTLGMSAALTLSDYMELKVLAASAKITGGLLGVELGPLLYKKLELAGELASFEIFNESVTLSDFGLIAGLWDSSVLIDAIPTNDAIRQQSRGRDASNDPFDPVNLRLLEDGSQPTNLTDTVVILGHLDGSGQTTRNNVIGDFVSDPGVAPPGDTGPATGQVTLLDGVVLPQGTEYRLARNAVRRLHLRGVEGDGFMRGDLGFLSLRSPDPAGVLTITGNGAVQFGRSGEIRAGTLLHGKGHTLYYSSLSSAYDSWGRHLFAAQKIDNSGRIWVPYGTLTPETPTFVNNASGLLWVTGGGRLNLRSTLYNEGLIQATKGSAADDAIIDIQAETVYGSLDGPAGAFLAERAGGIFLRRDPASPFSELQLARKLQFTSQGDGSSITFEGPISLSGAEVELVTESGATLVLNGLIRERESDAINIVNRGLLEVASGKTSLRVSGPNCPPQVPGCGGGPSSVVRPIDLVNEGTVRIHAGAEFAFDVDIVDYADGGATLAGGAWELLGQDVFFDNTQSVTNTARTAVMDVQVSGVFGNAERFSGLTFDETIDPATGQVSVSGISGLNTTLVYNNADVTLSGAAKFDYFNTLQVNRGNLTIRKHHQFHTAGTLENRGGNILVDTIGGLRVNGALLVNGGSVTVGDGSYFTAAGAMLAQDDGSTQRRDIEVNGGSLVFTANSLVTDQGLITSDAVLGHTLVQGRSWIVHDAVSTDATGTELVTPGLIDLAMRSGTLGVTGQRSGTTGVYRNDADVVLDGAQARFKGLETLTENYGRLAVKNGNVFTSEARGIELNSGAFDTGGFRNRPGGVVELSGGQFIQAANVFFNEGLISVGTDSYFKTSDFFGYNGSELVLGGVFETEGALLGATSVGALDLYGGTLIDGTGRLWANGFIDVLDGGTLITDEVQGNLNVQRGRFDFGLGASGLRVQGSYNQGAEGILNIDWGADGFDQLTVSRASLDGALQLSLLDGFMPEDGMSIEFLSASSLLGEFAPDVLLSEDLAGFLFSLRYEGSTVFLDVQAVPLPPALWLFAAALTGLFGFGRTRP